MRDKSSDSQKKRKDEGLRGSGLVNSVGGGTIRGNKRLRDFGGGASSTGECN